jgi:hypothetical protein
LYVLGSVKISREKVHPKLILAFGVCLSLEYTPRDQYRNKEGWALGVPLAVKASLKLRPCSQGYESRRPHTDRARSPVAQIGGLVLLGATTPKGGGALSCIFIPNQAAAKKKKKKKKKEVRREGVPSAAAAISAAGPASVLPPRLVPPSHPLPKKIKIKIKIQEKKEKEEKENPKKT